jgi:intergrase/recombinase
VILRYAKRYSYVLDDPGRAGDIHGLGKDMRRNVMASLANLSKFLGCYGYWKAIVSDAGLKWQKRSGLEAVLSILSTDLRDAKEWMVKAVGALTRKYSVVIAFETLTGVRPSEACISCGLITSLAEENRLSEYFDRELSMLEHFRFPRLFLRESKNCYISFVPEDLIELVVEVKPKVGYAVLKSALRKKGFPCRLMDLRKLYATRLRDQLPKEVIDLLQGRVGQSIFLRHYYKPYLAKVREQVFKTIEPLKNELKNII